MGLFRIDEVAAVLRSVVLASLRILNAEPHDSSIAYRFNFFA
jgi:hypothetical protein